jgi:hypothetical protein
MELSRREPALSRSCGLPIAELDDCVAEPRTQGWPISLPNWSRALLLHAFKQ